MTVKARTIDNLGIETSQRYAKDKELQDSKLLEDSHLISSKAEISVVKPYYPTELQEYLMPSPQTLWASFDPPPKYLAQGRPLFSYQLIPSLGDQEKQEADTDKLEALEDSLSRRNKKNKQGQNQQQEERECKILLHLMKTINRLDRTLGLINTRRSQYQRG